MSLQTRMAPSEPSPASVSTSSAPNAFRICFRSGEALAGRHSFTAIAFGRADHRVGDTGVPAGGIEQNLARHEPPVLSPSPDHIHAGRSFTEPPGLKNSAFAKTRTSPRAGGRDFEQRRVADTLQKIGADHRLQRGWHLLLV